MGLVRMVIAGRRNAQADLFLVGLSSGKLAATVMAG